IRGAHRRTRHRRLRPGPAPDGRRARVAGPHGSRRGPARLGTELAGDRRRSARGLPAGPGAAPPDRAVPVIPGTYEDGRGRRRQAHSTTRPRGDRMPTQEQVDAAEAIETALEEAELEYERPRSDAYLVTLPGERKLKTLVWLNIGEHSLLLKSFFCRRPDENEGEFYRYLMRRSSDMYGMAFTADDVGDVYITGRLPLAGITPEEVDRLLGCVLSYSDDNFNPALERGFATAIR